MKQIKKYHLLILCISSSLLCTAQNLDVKGGFLINTAITLGNQNQWLKIGIFGFGILNYGDISAESGVSLASYYFTKRHTVKTSGMAYSYEFFALGGLGKNSNLLGSSVSNLTNTVIFNANGKGGFNGLGFGFSKDNLPHSLKSYGLKRGAFMMRFSNAEHSIHISFQNDFNIGLFNGAGTDYGVTGSLDIGFTKITSADRIFKTGIEIDLFTARPDYTRSPRNPINSDDGRKNVWFTLPPFKDLFYGNLFGYATYQNQHLSAHTKIGINSQKTGAHIQNILHDGLGLNPRFPWRVSSPDKAFIETRVSSFINVQTDD